MSQEKGTPSKETNSKKHKDSWGKTNLGMCKLSLPTISQQDYFVVHYISCFIVPSRKLKTTILDSITFPFLAMIFFFCHIFLVFSFSFFLFIGFSFSPVLV